MKKIIITVLTAGALALCAAGPAAATQPTDQFHTVLWEITSPNDDHFFTPQVYVATFEGDDTSHWVGDTTLKCGTKYQADAYVPSAVAALIADGLLKGGEDQGIAHHWLVFTTAACEVVVPPVVVPPVEVPPVTEEPPVVVEEPVLPPVVEIPAPLADPVVLRTAPPTLAATGVDPTVSLLSASALLLMGIGLLARKRFSRQ